MHLLFILLMLPNLSHARHIMVKDQRILHTSVSSPFWKNKGNAIAGVMNKNTSGTRPGLFRTGNSGYVWFNLINLSEYLEGFHNRPACDELRFKDELNPYSCTAFLVGPQTVMTAGHCVDHSKTMTKSGKYLLTKNVPLTGNDELTIHFSKGVPPKNGAQVSSDEVYKGVMLVEGIKTYNLDYAIVKLDRPVKGIVPLEIDQNFKPQKNLSTRVIGHPSGLRLMHDSSGKIINSTEYWKPLNFTISNTVFAGNSGSPVLDNRNGKVLGVLSESQARAKSDYYLNDSQCVTANVVGANETQAQGFVTRLTVTAEYLKGKLPEYDKRYMEKYDSP